MSRKLSEAVFEKSQDVIPGGVNSPVRAFGSVGGTPPVLARGKGSHVWDIDGNEYVDWMSGVGPIILGYADEVVDDAVKEQIARGSLYTSPTTSPNARSTASSRPIRPPATSTSTWSRSKAS